jgi:hypothetical protein
VLFNLSTWAVKRPPLTKWLVDELIQRYDVPRKVAQAWVEHDVVLPLLDGLDEVAIEHRDSCVQAINEFRREHGLLPLVVTSRSAEYAALSERLRLPGAVIIEPLSREQVERYLEQGGVRFSGMRAAVRTDDTLWELLDTPLMMSIARLAFPVGDTPASDLLAGGTTEERRKRLFDRYIEAMLTRRSSALRYPSDKTRHWLSWLAGAMVRNEQTVFYLERMQPDWLPKGHRSAF